MLRRGVPPFFVFKLGERGMVEPGLRGLTRGPLREGIRFFKHPKAIASGDCGPAQSSLAKLLTDYHNRTDYHPPKHARLQDRPESLRQSERSSGRVLSYIK